MLQWLDVSLTFCFFFFYFSKFRETSYRDSHKKLGKLCGLSTKSSDEQCDRLENEMKEMCPPKIWWKETHHGHKQDKRQQGQAQVRDRWSRRDQDAYEMQIQSQIQLTTSKT